MTLIKWSNHPVMSEMMNNIFDKGFNNCYHTRPSANITENDENFSIELAVPGMKKSDFNIDLDNDILTISTKKEKKEEKEENFKYIRKEFSYSQFSHSFSLSENIDKENIKAEYKDGILSILLPKMETAKADGPKSIKVS